MRANRAQFNIADMICKYLKYQDFEKKLSPHSLRAYRSDLVQVFQLSDVCTFYGPSISGDPEYFFKAENNQLFTLTPTDCRTRAEGAQRRWSKLQPKTRKRKISSINGFFLWLKTFQGFDVGLPLEDHIRSNRKIPNFISVDECISLLNVFKSHKDQDKASHQQEWLFYLLYGCGMRVSEACNIKWQDVSLSRRSIRLLGKGRKERLVILPKPIARKLEKADQTDLYIWGSKPLATRTAYERIRQLGKKAGLLKPLHPHALRHSYATHLLSSGSDLRILQQLLGHQSLAATELYTHLDIDQLATSMERYHPLSKKD